MEGSDLGDFSKAQCLKTWESQCIESGRLMTGGCGNSVREHGIVEVEKRLRASRHGRLRDCDGSDHGMRRAWDCG